MFFQRIYWGFDSGVTQTQRGQSETDIDFRIKRTSMSRLRTLYRELPFNSTFIGQWQQGKITLYSSVRKEERKAYVIFC